MGRPDGLLIVYGPCVSTRPPVPLYRLNVRFIGYSLLVKLVEMFSDEPWCKEIEQLGAHISVNVKEVA